MATSSKTRSRHARSKHARPTAARTSAARPSLSSRRRVFFLSSILVLLVPGVIMYKLVDFQLLDNDELIARGQNQRIYTRELPARRGDIYDSNRELLATSLISYTIWADPGRIGNPQQVASQLSPILEVPSPELHDRLVAQGAFSYLKRKVSQQTKDAVVELDIDGVGFFKEYARHYPVRSSVNSSFVGFVGSEEQGLAGIEFSQNSHLDGTPGLIYLEGDPNGNPIALGERSEQPAEPGASVYLTVDSRFQFQTEKILLEQVEATQSMSGTAIVAEPGSGRILSMATVLRHETDAEVGSEANTGNGADADSGADSKADPAPTYTYEVSNQNRATTWTYEPGSALKPLTFAAILDSDTADPQSVREVPASLSLYDSLFEDHDWHPPLDMSVAEIMRVSSNIGTILWSQELGQDLLHEYLLRFGVGRPLLSEELPGESGGQLLDLKDWSGTSAATIALGQGVALTPLQMLNVFNILANDGVMVAPHLVADVIDAQGQRVGPEISSPTRVVSEQTAHEMTDMLVNVVQAGTGKSAAVDNYLVAGKTGTARKPLPTGGYEDEDGNYRYITTFAGFLPADNPAVSIIVVLEEPQNSIYASQTAAPTFAQLATEAVRHFHIPPSVATAQPQG